MENFFLILPLYVDEIYYLLKYNFETFSFFDPLFYLRLNLNIHNHEIYQTNFKFCFFSSNIILGSCIKFRQPLFKILIFFNGETLIGSHTTAS